MHIPKSFPSISCLTKISLLIFPFLLIPNISPAIGEKAVYGLENSNCKPPQKVRENVLTFKTLDRKYDPVVVPGDLLPNFHDLQIKNLRLYAHNGEKFTIIPFQVDERDPEGEFVLTDGEVAGTDIDNGLFDHNDEVVLMVKDTGSQVPKKIWSEMGDRGAEIIVTDPRDAAKKGWAYLIYFPKNPPPLSEKDYVHYTPGKEIVESAFYKMKYMKGSPFYMDLIYPKEAGGSGEDFFDRVKVRLTVTAFFNLIHIEKTEEDFRSVVVGWKDGPVRAMRRVENYFRILFNLSSPSIFSVNEYYERLTYTPVQLTIPFRLKWVFNSFGINDWTWRIYGDFPGLKGGAAYTDRNLEGFQFTGNHSPKYLEKHIDMSRFSWGYNTKEGVGTWFPNVLLPELLYGIVTLYVVDDEKFLDPPDDTPGLIGAGMKGQWKGFNQNLMEMLEPGTYELSLDTYFPHPSIKIHEVDEWLQIRGFPLIIDVEGEKEAYITTVDLKPNGRESGKGKTSAGGWEELVDEDRGSFGVLTDTRGREFHLHQIFFYSGSYRVTPREHILGRLFSKKKYMRPDFEDIRRIDHRFEKVDPISGMKNPMVQKMTMQNGEVIDMLGCKPCGFSGLLPDGKKIFLWDTQIQSVEFRSESSP